MSEFMINTNMIDASARSMSACGLKIRQIGNSVSGVRTNLYGTLPPAQTRAISQSLGVIARNINEISRCTVAASQVLTASKQMYVSTDKKVAGSTSAVRARVKNKTAGPQLQTSLISAFTDEFNLKDIIKSFGNIGKSAGYVISAITAKSWRDWLKIGVGVGTTGYKIFKDIANYAKIGRAVGGKNAVAWFLKKQIGLRNVGHASTCKNPISRFYNNLHNSTSPYNMKDAFSSFTGKKGVGSAIASWAGVAVNGVINAYGNYEEYKASGGKMSKTRAVVETISETAIDTVVTTAATAVVGAAITAATGVVAAPAVVAIATGVGLAAINAGVKHLTGKSATEFVSDGIIDAGTAVGKFVGKNAKKAGKAVANWFNKAKKKIF